MSGWACIARMGGIGDNLMAASALRPLKRLGYKTEVITSGLAHVVFQNNPFLDKLSVKGDKDIPNGPDNRWHEWFAARSNEFELFAHLSHVCENRHALQINQTSFWWREDYRRKLCGGNYLETVHDVVGVPHNFGPLFFPTADERARAERTKKELSNGRYIAWVLAGSRPDKVWPYTLHAIPRIVKELGIQVFVFGVGGQQFLMATEIQKALQSTNSTDSGMILCLSPDSADPGGHQHWPIRRSITQAQLADLVVTPDTGLAWGVAMESMPKIAMVSHASAENITKHWVNTTTLHADPVRVPCWPCHRLHNTMDTCKPAENAPQTAACMADISVERLIREIGDKLSESNVVPLRSAS